MIMSQFAWPLGKIFFDIARTYQSYRASLILAFSDAQGALLVYTLLPGALDLYRERINSLFRMVSIWVFLQQFWQSSGIYCRISANTPDNLFLESPCWCFRHHSLQ